MPTALRCKAFMSKQRCRAVKVLIAAIVLCAAVAIITRWNEIRFLKSFRSSVNAASEYNNLNYVIPACEAAKKCTSEREVAAVERRCVEGLRYQERTGFLPEGAVAFYVLLESRNSISLETREALENLERSTTDRYFRDEIRYLLNHFDSDSGGVTPPFAVEVSQQELKTGID